MEAWSVMNLWTMNLVEAVLRQSPLTNGIDKGDVWNGVVGDLPSSIRRTPILGQHLEYPGRPCLQILPLSKRVEPGKRVHLIHFVGESRIPDSLAERVGFEPPVPLGLAWAEFGPSVAHYSAQIKASVLERICSPRVRLWFGSLRFPSFAGWCSESVDVEHETRFGVRITPPGRAVRKKSPS
jgi:hypothetical protein